MAQALVAELARLRVLVQAAVLELAQMQAQRLVQVPELELALGLQLEREPPVVWVLEPPLVLVQGRESARQQALAAVPESPQSQEPAVKPERVREPRVSRQQEQQQHRLQAAAQEPLPYLPVLPKKAPC